MFGSAGSSAFSGQYYSGPGSDADTFNKQFAAMGGSMAQPGSYAPSSYAGALSGGGGYQPAFNSQLAGTYANALSKQYNQAFQANQDQFNKMLGLAQGYGQGELGYSKQLTDQQVSQGQQQMADRGLYNSTIANAVQRSAQDQGALRDANIRDQSTQLQLGVYGQNQIKYPDLGAYASLMSQPGAFSGQSGAGALLGAMAKFQTAPGGAAPVAKR